MYTSPFLPLPATSGIPLPSLSLSFHKLCPFNIHDVGDAPTAVGWDLVSPFCKPLWAYLFLLVLLLFFLSLVFVALCTVSEKISPPT